MSEVSVIIPTFNRAHTILRALDSVFESTFKDFEVIVVDDGSTDETKELLQNYPRPIGLISCENSGVSTARNLGAQAATSKWLAFLDSDDEWLPQKLQKQLDFVSDHPQYKLLHSDEVWIRNGVRVNPKKRHQKWGGEVFLKCVEQCFISPSTCLIDREFFHQLGGFDESFVVCEDYDLWLRASLCHPIGHINEPLIKKYGGHEDQLSTRYFAMDLWRLRALDRLVPKVSKEEHKRGVMQFVIRQGSILLTGFQKHNNTEHCQEVIDMITRARSLNL